MLFKPSQLKKRAPLGWILILPWITPTPAHAMGKSAPTPGRRQIINPEMSRTYPWNLIGRIEASRNSKPVSSCTGIRVSRRVVMSAAHCFYQYLSTASFSSGESTGDSFTFEDPITRTSLRIVSFETGSQYGRNTQPSLDLHSGKDWAVAILSDSAQHVSQYLEILPEGEDLPPGTPLQAAGYSIDMAGGQSLSRDPSCQVLSPLSQTIHMAHTDCQMWEGASGGPDLMADSQGKIWITGVHTSVLSSNPTSALSTSIDEFREPLARAIRSTEAEPAN